MSLISLIFIYPLYIQTTCFEYAILSCTASFFKLLSFCYPGTPCPASCGRLFFLATCFCKTSKLTGKNTRASFHYFIIILAPAGASFHYFIIILAPAGAFTFSFLYQTAVSLAGDNCGGFLFFVEALRRVKL